MRSSILAVFSALTLTLAACGDSGDEVAESTPSPATATTEAASGVQELVLGETMTITRCGGDLPCNVEVTLTKATLTETCPFGVSYPDMESMDTEGSLYLTFDGEFHVIESANNFSVGEADFTAVDGDGYATTDLTAWDCESLDVDKHLDNPVDPGLKRAGHLTLAIPPNTETIRFTQFWDPVTWEFDITDLELAPGAGERPLATGEAPAGSPAPTPATAVEPPAPAPAQSGSIFNPPGVGVQCPGTDAWVNDISLCTPANLGGEPLPAAPAPAPADAFPYPTSGEAQAHYGCQQGYITDPAICDEMFAKYGR